MRLLLASKLPFIIANMNWLNLASAVSLVIAHVHVLSLSLLDWLNYIAEGKDGMKKI